MDRTDHPQTRPTATLALVSMGLAYWAAHLLVLTRYGWFRDELYYVACARRLAWGYVDHPPLSIAVLAVVRALAGDSLVAVRLVPGLTGACVVVLTGLMAREMGASRFGQILAAACMVAAPVFLFTTHIYSMNALDLLFWTAGALMLLVALRRGGAAWLWLGALLGLGLLNKISILWLGGGLAAGLLLTPHRRRLATPWPWLGGALAGLIFAPHLLWQVRTGWPTLEFMRNATTEKMVPVGYGEFVKMQLDALHPFTAPIWIGGLVFCLALPRGRAWRIMGWIFLFVFLLLMTSGTARASYLSPAFPMMFAAGGVAWEGWLSGPRGRRLRPALVAVLLAGFVIAAPFTLPVLPVDTLVRYAAALGVQPHQEEHSRLGRLPQHYADMFGWEELAATVAQVYDTLPPEDRARCVIFTENYGEAAALELFGPRYGLPPVISGHNNYWLWGPRGYTGAVVIAVGGDREDEEANFREATLAARTACGDCMPYENGLPIWLGRDLKTDLAALWPRLKQYE